MNERIRYSVVVPVFNEEAVIAETCRRLNSVMKGMDAPYELIFVDDGSQDRTAQIIKELLARDSHIRMITFSRNFGHQIAVTAGIDYAKGDAVVLIDADLQDPPELIPLMAEKWEEGFDVVYARRCQRKGETLFKRCSAALFYRTLRMLTEVSIPLDTGDFRLIDRKVCDVMRGMQERNRFVRGLVSWAGFKQTSIEYVREERFAGKTKYSLKKMLRLSADGITSFSTRPLTFAAFLGIAVMVPSLAAMLIIFGQTLFGGQQGAATRLLIAGGFFVNGLLLTSQGIMGEYVGRIYEEAQQRPLYVVAGTSQAEQEALREVSLCVHQ